MALNIENQIIPDYLYLEFDNKIIKCNTYFLSLIPYFYKKVFKYDISIYNFSNNSFENPFFIDRSYDDACLILNSYKYQDEKLLNKNDIYNEFEYWEEKYNEINDCSNEIIIINVSGYKFKTTKKTLIKTNYYHNIFIFDGIIHELDMNYKSFDEILKYLRNENYKINNSYMNDFNYLGVKIIYKNKNNNNENLYNDFNIKNIKNEENEEPLNIIDINFNNPTFTIFKTIYKLGTYFNLSRLTDKIIINKNKSINIIPHNNNLDVLIDILIISDNEKINIYNHIKYVEIYIYNSITKTKNKLFIIDGDTYKIIDIIYKTNSKKNIKKLFNEHILLNLLNCKFTIEENFIIEIHFKNIIDTCNFNLIYTFAGLHNEEKRKMKDCSHFYHAINPLIKKFDCFIKNNDIYELKTPLKINMLAVYIVIISNHEISGYLKTKKTNILNSNVFTINNMISNKLFEYYFDVKLNKYVYIIHNYIHTQSQNSNGVWQESKIILTNDDELYLKSNDQNTKIKIIFFCINNYDIKNNIHRIYSPRLLMNNVEPEQINYDDFNDVYKSKCNFNNILDINDEIDDNDYFINENEESDDNDDNDNNFEENGNF